MAVLHEQVANLSLPAFHSSSLRLLLLFSSSHLLLLSSSLSLPIFISFFYIPSPLGIFLYFPLSSPPLFLSFSLPLIFFFVLKAPRHLEQGKLAGVTLGSYLRSENYSDALINELLYPMLTVACTCSYSSVASYPADVIVAYYNSYGAWSWFPNPSRTSKFSSGDHCRVSEGVCDVVEKLSRRCTKIHLGTKILSVSPEADGKRAAVEYIDGETGERRLEEFDKIVVATQAHHARDLLNKSTTVSSRAFHVCLFSSFSVMFCLFRLVLLVFLVPSLLLLLVLLFLLLSVSFFVLFLSSSNPRPLFLTSPLFLSVVLFSSSYFSSPPSSSSSIPFSSLGSSPRPGSRLLEPRILPRRGSH